VATLRLITSSTIAVSNINRTTCVNIAAVATSKKRPFWPSLLKNTYGKFHRGEADRSGTPTRDPKGVVVKTRALSMPTIHCTWLLFFRQGPCRKARQHDS